MRAAATATPTSTTTAVPGSVSFNAVSAVQEGLGVGVMDDVSAGHAVRGLQRFVPPLKSPMVLGCVRLSGRTRKDAHHAKRVPVLAS